MFNNLNPYIHGTQSDILNILPKTDFHVLGPIEMIEQYGISPITGEITGGGFSSVGDRCSTCFGRLIPKDLNTYTLSKVLRYTESSNNTESDNLTIKQLQSYVNNAIRSGYCNINIIIILMMRCQQLGQNIDHIITNDFIVTAKIIRNVFATLFFFGTWLIPCADSNNDDLYDAIYTHFDLQHIQMKLESIPNCPDFFETYLEYKDRPLELPDSIKNILLQIFTLPKISTIKSGFLCVDKEVNLDITIPFVFSNNDANNDSNYKYSKFKADYISYRLPQNCSGYRINDLLESHAKHTSPPSFWMEFHERLSKFVINFQHRIDLLERMKNRTEIPQITSDLSSFPLILVCEKDDLMTDNGNEHRAKRPLKLGEDILTIATNDETNRIHLINYLKKYDIKCQVLLFNQL